MAYPGPTDTSPSHQPLLRIMRSMRTALIILMQSICLVTGFSIAGTLMLGIVYRYLLQSSLAWAAELPGILFPWLVMSGATLAAINRQHLGIDYFVAKLDAKVQQWISLAIHMLLVAILIALAVISLDMLEILNRQMTPVLYWPRSWAFAGLPFGLFALAAALVTDIPTLLLQRGIEESTRKV
jgi:TRAP-type C4-dicarboxylate transport system permease small subunit